MNDKVVEIYEKWSKKNNMSGGFIPFCRQDNWSGHVVKNFADFIVEEITNNFSKKMKNIDKRIRKLEKSTPNPENTKAHKRQEESKA